MVALEPSTGRIRAVADNPAQGFNTAFGGAEASGSTMKIVTAAMMRDKGLVQGAGSKGAPRPPPPTSDRAGSR
ncbi:hypothetical protein ACWENA_21520 [Streptomyces sp. NPDC004779]